MSPRFSGSSRIRVYSGVDRFGVSLPRRRRGLPMMEILESLDEEDLEMCNATFTVPDYAAFQA